MRTLLTAAALCMALQAAQAQAPAPTCAPATAGTPVAAQPAPATTAAPHGELIKTAAASTRDGAPVAAARPRGEHPQHGSTAMLLAALALMSGIALRRWGGPRA